MSDKRFSLVLAALLLVALVVRAGYVLAQPAFDPAFDLPMLDGAYYLDWARELARGESGPEGAYYLAPLYPLLLSLLLRVAGESFTLLYLLQHGAVLATAALLALVGRRLAGEMAGLAAAALLVLYRPALFFASRPLGEALSLALLALALWVFCRSGDRRAAVGAGLAAGVAALARPNLLAVPALWAAAEVGDRRPVRAALVVLGVALALLPVTLRNAAVSGHFVPVSSNAGITLFHGNGEGAAGVYTPPWSFGGALPTLRREATLQARLQSGRELDPVEADRWWARQAIKTRLDDPLGSVTLFGRKLALLSANEELGLDYDPALDRNPWRWGAPLPFAVLLALAAAGLVLVGFSGTGRWPVWSTVAACVATPLIFYVSSRYRLPMAVMLCLPAGAGVAALLSPPPGVDLRRRALALGVAVILGVGSVSIPTGVVGEELKAGALANRASAWMERGDLAAAERDLRAALAYDPERVRMASVGALFNLAVVLEKRGAPEESEATYRRALRIDPSHVESAGNLARLLVDGGRAAEAVPVLRRALAERPDFPAAWANLVVALAVLDDLPAAREAAEQAAGYGVRLDPELLRAIGAPPPASGR